jgi:alpha-amylase
MKTNRRTLCNRIHSSVSAVGILLGVVASPGCMDFTETGEIPLQNHVQDWREEIIYQVLVDRFADGDWGNNYSIFPSAPGKWHGGDWKGLEDKLDYLEGLGVTAIWISPVVKNVYTDAGFDAYHGYWAQDLTQPSPQFGDLESLRSLVKAAHERKMKVVLDIVTNHMGQLFYYDINGNGQADDPLSISRGKDIYKENEYDPTYDVRGVQASTSLGESGLAEIIFAHDPASNHMPPFPAILQNKLAYNRKGRTYNFDDPDQLRRGDFPGGLKDVNTEKCAIRETMTDAYARWIELTDIDGLRIDTIKHVERGFWRYFGYKVRERLHAKGKTNFFMFGEAFDGRDPLVGSYTKNGSELPLEDEAGVDGLCADDLNGDQVDSVFYFPQQFQVFRDVFRYRGPTSNIQRLLNDRAVNYGNTPALRGPVDADGNGISPQKLLVNFLDNHDVPRFLFTGAGNYPEDPIFGASLSFMTRRKMLHNALLYLYTEEGIPCVYYGTEQDFQGGNDPGNREDMWPTQYDTNSSTYKWMGLLANARKNAALSKGDLSIKWSSDRTGQSDDDANIVAFERKFGTDAAIVIINAGLDKCSSPSFGGSSLTVDAASYRVVLSTDDVIPSDDPYVLDPNYKQGDPLPAPKCPVIKTGDTFTASAGQLSITIPPSSGVILVPQ